MSLLNLHQLTGFSCFPLPFRFLSPLLRFEAPRAQFSVIKSRKYVFCSSYTASPILFVSLTKQRRARVSLGRADEKLGGKKYEQEEEESDDDLGEEGEVFQKTLRLVECSMFASVAGLAYFLSNSLAIEASYFVSEFHFKRNVLK
ncbi:hypothetical protein KSP40_PGU003381 [Platanthera guangdongensis]|uniref:Uncharacterized protein n=1 Tax=Platanthera guangdongensis TaxID=2320717 RepID=A0ABR2MPB6_9ASPA